MNKKKIVASIIVLIVVFAIGRYSRPAKIIEKERVVEKIVEKTITVEKENKNKSTITLETILPDGTIKREIREIDKGVVIVDTNASSIKDTKREKEKIVINSKDSLIVYLAGGTRIGSSLTPTYGIGVKKRVIGPFWLGAYGTNNKDVALTLGISL